MSLLSILILVVAILIILVMAYVIVCIVRAKARLEEDRAEGQKRCYEAHRRNRKQLIETFLYSMKKEFENGKLIPRVDDNYNNIVFTNGERQVAIRVTDGEDTEVKLVLVRKDHNNECITQGTVPNMIPTIVKELLS
ncbi:MAG: hypothetical protein PHP35_02195 [Candidatus Colwellbacteria bacterium]|nr:hypothetical protein [Candidatus Colwellbacteria bacterium]